MDEVALSSETEAAPRADPGGKSAPAFLPLPAAGTGGGDDGPGREVLIFNWWDACQLALVFVLIQYIAHGVADHVGAALIGSWPQSASLLADQLAVAAFPVAWLFLIQPRARQMFHDPRLGRAELLALVALSPPFICVQEFVSWQAPLTCGLPVVAANAPSMYESTLGLVATCVIGPAVEEIFFCGILGRNLILRQGPLMGTLVTAAIFAATRAGQSQVGAAFVLGMACQLSYLGTGSIAAPILLHALTNCFGPNFVDRPDLDAPLVRSALLAVSVLGYAVFTGHLRTWDGRFRAGRQPPGPAAPAPPGAFDGPGLRHVAMRCLVLLSPLPFYALVFYRLQPLIFRRFDLLNL
jgi:membrane protease YdiL (CAAX protease family)